MINNFNLHQPGDLAFSPQGDALDISNLSISQTPRADPKMNRHSLGVLSSIKGLNKLTQSRVSHFLYEDIQSSGHHAQPGEDSDVFCTPFQNSTQIVFSPAYGSRQKCMNE